MSADREITSRDNARFKALRRLAESGRERRKSGLTLLDGVHLAEAWEGAGLPVVEYFVRGDLAAGSEIMAFLRARPSARATRLPSAMFDEVSVVDTPSGLLAVVEMPASAGHPAADVDTVVLDGVQDPGNLGSILRTAAAAGVRQAVLTADCASPWHPRTLRAGMGAQCVLAMHDHCDVPAFLADFRGAVAATVLAESRDLYAIELPEPIAWIFGSEGVGVRPEVATHAGLHVRIGMATGIESLNVAAAAAVCLFETRRQRRLMAEHSESKCINKKMPKA